jgi:hypothetical protein
MHASIEPSQGSAVVTTALGYFVPFYAINKIK